MVYQACIACLEETQLGEYWHWSCHEPSVRECFKVNLEYFMDTLEGDSYTLALTDSEANWRLDVLPTYKGNRKNKKPLALKATRQWLMDDLDAYFRPRLEGDDILGILATWSLYMPGTEKVIVSLDKDMKTIPGLYYRREEDGIIEIDEAAADRWHMFQTLTGDPTDGYDGCPGMGPVSAEPVVLHNLAVRPYQHTLTRGKRKGEVETRYEEYPANTLWEAVVSRYEAAGLTEEDALVQARVARILRRTDYDLAKKQPILWTP